MAAINAIDITSLLFQEGSAPTTPASTKWRLYFKTDGLYVRDDAGTETGPLAASSGGGEALANEFVGVGHPMLASSITNQLAANRVYLAKYSPRVDVTVTTANIYINTSNGNLDFGIYNSDFSSLLASVGTTASPGTGLRTFAFSGAASVAMDAGTIYYLAMQVSSTTFRCPTYVPPGAQTTGHNILGREDAGSMPIPSSIASVDAWEDGFVFPMFYFT